MKAGRLRHRITLETLLVELDSDGEQTETWVSFIPDYIPAEQIPLSGRELVASEAVSSKITTRWKIRYRPSVVASMRIRHRGDIFNIEAVVPDPESGRQWLTLHCSSGVNEGV